MHLVAIGSLVEDYIIPEVDERHGVIKTPTEEEEREISDQKYQAYMELAHQLEEAEPQELVLPPSPQQGTTVNVPHGARRTSHGHVKSTLCPYRVLTSRCLVVKYLLSSF